jgi:hypothetical protein
LINNIPSNEFHFAGHDTFHLRYSWLPKAADYLNNSSKGVSLSHYEVVMTKLGIGKNMAKSLRHWSESSQLFDKKNEYHDFSPLGAELFYHDPYLEHVDSNWLIHYLIVSNHKKNGLWFYLFNVFNEQIIIKEEFLFSAKNWFKDMGVESNERTLEKDFQCCMNMYDSSKISSSKASESLTLSPLRELKLLRKVGSNYHLRTLVNKEISSAMFSYCLLDYLECEGDQNSTPFSDILNGMKSPGRIFRLTESLLMDYLNNLDRYSKDHAFDNTSGMQQVMKINEKKRDKILLLKKVYG